MLQAQPVPLPNTMDGFVSGQLTAQVTLDTFIDLLCPDCAADYPTIKQVAAHYGPAKLQWRMHFFPLPYHTWAFMAAQTAHTIKAVNGSDAA
jgi:protein-disulfide isomerase